MPTAHDIGAQQTDDPSLSRVGTFSDGVFAIAITLLVLAIRIPIRLTPMPTRDC
jgi:uncharacterized membrane protein